MSAQVTETPHDALGLTADDLCRMHRTLLTARLLDEASLRQNRMGRAPFVVPVSGHEGCQIGTAWPMRRGTDIWLPYYRDLGVVLVAGHDAVRGLPRRLLQGRRPASGGRQMPSHWGSRRLGIISRLLADRDAGPARRRHRVRGEVPAARTPSSRAGSGRARRARATGTRGSTSPAIHQLPVHLRLREQRVRDQRARSPSRWRCSDVATRAEGYGFPGVVVDGNDVLACYARDEGGARPRARRRRPDA